MNYIILKILCTGMVLGVLSCAPVMTGHPHLIRPQYHLKTSAPLGSPHNPVKCDLPSGEREYLERLICPKGDDVEYERSGSVGIGPYGNIMDLYSIRCNGADSVYSVYMDMYHSPYVEERPVPGFSIRERNNWEPLMHSVERNLNSRNFNKALEALDQALAETDKTGDHDERKVVTLRFRTHLLYGMERYEEARDDTERVIELVSSTEGQDSPQLMMDMIVLAMLNAELKDENFDYLIPTVYEFHQNHMNSGIEKSEIFTDYLKVLRNHGMDSVAGRLKVMFEVN
jgi:hypothetical protein